MILTFSLAHDQYDWTSGELILNNGDPLKELIRISMSVAKLVSFGKSRVEFEENSKEDLYDENGVIELVNDYNLLCK